MPTRASLNEFQRDNFAKMGAPVKGYTEYALWLREAFEDARAGLLVAFKCDDFSGNERSNLIDFVKKFGEGSRVSLKVVYDENGMLHAYVFTLKERKV